MFESIIKKWGYYQFPIQHMIAGIEISSIKPNDFYLRFLMLEKIMNRRDMFVGESKKGQNRDGYVLVKYQNLIKELTSLERHIQNENNQYSHRELDSQLTLEEMEKEYQRCFVSAEASASQYERKMMQTWRDGITKNEEKEKIGRNQSETRATNNKNLMLLTSELLKKQRQTKLVIKDEQEKIIRQIQKVRNLLAVKKQLFEENIIKMNQVYLAQMQKNEKIASLENQRKDKSVEKQLQKLDLNMQKCRKALAYQKQKSELVFTELQSLLDDLRTKLL